MESQKIGFWETILPLFPTSDRIAIFFGILIAVGFAVSSVLSVFALLGSKDKSDVLIEAIKSIWLGYGGIVTVCTNVISFRLGQHSSRDAKRNTELFLENKQKTEELEEASFVKKSKEECKHCQKHCLTKNEANQNI
jgi:hypothetical protein